MEDGTIDPRHGLLTFPQDVQNGYVIGIYPSIQVQSGDHFQAVVNCEYGAEACFVVFRLDYQIGYGTIRTIWAFLERNEGITYPVDIDLSFLAGQDVKFVLTTFSAGDTTDDRALWVAPRIVR